MFKLVVWAVLVFPLTRFCLRILVLLAKWAVWFPIMVVKYGFYEAKCAAELPPSEADVSLPKVVVADSGIISTCPPTPLRPTLAVE